MHDTTRRRVARSLGIAIALTLGLALAGALFADVVHADTPDPRNCVADPVLISAPDGGFAYRVTLRDGGNQPVAGGTAILDFNPGPSLLLCDDQDPDHDGRVVGTANASGVVTFSVRVGSNGGVGTMNVIAATYVIATVSVRTMDFDGDRDVDAADRAALAALVGTSGPAGDYDRNGTVNSADQTIFESRFGGSCTLLEASPATWGAIKHTYR